MKTKFCFHLLILTIFTLLFSSCSKQNDALAAKSDNGFQENMSVYPHPVTWKNQHMGFMANNKVEKSCMQCHQDKLGTPLKISCAIQCHQTATDTIPAKDAPTPVANKCTLCHAPVTQNKFGHYPANAGVCTTCHTVSDKHLAGEGDPVDTKSSANDCYRCHTRQDNQPNVHTALTSDENSCVGCHNPHGGNQRFFLRDFSGDKDVTVKALCTQCHTTDINDMAVKHGAVENQKSCLNCHNPHSSKNTKQLKMPVKELCLSCHDKPIQATLSEPRVIPNMKAKVDTAKANMGSCIDCHTAHGSQFNRILIDNFSITNYNDYPPVGKAANPYALCAQCHDTDSLLNKEDIETTSFRTPTKNLHWKHVVEESKSCNICHDSHGSKNDVFIRDYWSMNGQPIGINFTKTATGGNCTMTCHDLRTYNR